MIRRPPRSPLFPSTTLSRSEPDQLVLRPAPAGLCRHQSHERRLRISLLPGPESQRALRHEREIGRHTSELQSRLHLVCRLLLEKKKKSILISYNDSTHQLTA